MLEEGLSDPESGLRFPASTVDACSLARCPQPVWQRRYAGASRSSVFDRVSAASWARSTRYRPVGRACVELKIYVQACQVASVTLGVDYGSHLL